MIRLGWSITRLSSFTASTTSVCCDYADFPDRFFAEAFETKLRQAHDQDNYDVRTWSVFLPEER